MNPIVHTVLVVATSTGLLFAGHMALRYAPGQDVPPPSAPTAAQLAHVNGQLTAQAQDEAQALGRLSGQEQSLQATIARLQQDVQAYRQATSGAGAGRRSFRRGRDPYDE